MIIPKANAKENLGRFISSPLRKGKRTHDFQNPDFSFVIISVAMVMGNSLFVPAPAGRHLHNVALLLNGAPEIRHKPENFQCLLGFRPISPNLSHHAFQLVLQNFKIQFCRHGNPNTYSEWFAPPCSHNFREEDKQNLSYLHRGSTRGAQWFGDCREILRSLEIIGGDCLRDFQRF